MQSPAVDTMDKYNENLTDVKEIFRKGDLRAIPKPLLKWYDNNRRILPWREDPADIFCARSGLEEMIALRLFSICSAFWGSLTMLQE